MRVPEEAALGTAKVTFSFDAWIEGNVKPTTITLPVKKAKPITKASQKKVK